MLSTLSFNNKLHFLFRFQDDGGIDSFDVLRCFNLQSVKLCSQLLLDKISPKIVWNKYQCLNGCNGKTPLLQDTLKQHHMNLSFAMVSQNSDLNFTMGISEIIYFFIFEVFRKK